MSAAQKILSISTSDQGGGAERVAWTLFKGFERAGAQSWLAVGNKKSTDPNVYAFHHSWHVDYRPYANARLQRDLVESKQRDAQHGVEDFNFPYSHLLATIAGTRPDIILCHNLHGGYFDLRALAKISREIPVVLLLHDSWSFTGHCAHPVRCERWRHGCGSCPDLSLPPRITADATAFNWSRKAAIYRDSRLHVAAPTRWLLDRARQSMLAPAMAASRVIPCPVDMACRPADKAAVRRLLDLPEHAAILVYAAFEATSNPYKDYPTIESALRELAARMPDRDVLFIALGQAAAERQFGRIRLRFLPFQSPARVVQFLQAADICLHAAHVENFGLVCAEALACGTPVVSTAVGGLPEVIRHGERGLLVPAGDARSLAESAARLLEDDDLKNQLGRQAADYARDNWHEDIVTQQYLEWFDDILGSRRSRPSRTAASAEPRVHIGHHFYGAGNFGDDLMLAGFLQTWRQRGMQATLTCSTPFDRLAQQRRFPEVSWLPYDLEARTHAIRHCTVWLGLGGPAFETVSGDWMLEHLETDRRLCERFGKPMYLLCAGVSNREALLDPRARALLEQVEHVWTRDADVAEWLREVCDESRITAGADLAHLFLAGIEHARPREGHLSWLLHFDDSSLLRMDALNTAIELCADHKQSWLVQEIRELAGSELATFRALAPDARARLELCAPDYANASMAELLHAWPADASVVTSRFHGALIAAWRGAHIVVVERDDKLRAAARMLGCLSLPAMHDAMAIRQALSMARPVLPVVLRHQRDLALQCCLDFFQRLHYLTGRAALSGAHAFPRPAVHLR